MSLYLKSKSGYETLHIPIVCIITFFTCLCACNNNDSATGETDKTEKKAAKIKEESVTYILDTLNMNNYMVYDENIEGKRPAVLVIHEWWGLNDYAKGRAKMLAEMGYIAMAVD